MYMSTRIFDVCAVNSEETEEEIKIQSKVFDLINKGLENIVGTPYNKSELVKRANECLAELQDKNVINNFKIVLLEEDEDMKAVREVLEETDDEISIEATVQIPYEVSYIRMDLKIGNKI